MQGGTQICRKCQSALPWDGFYKHPSMKSGRDTICKECVKERVQNNREKKLDYYRAFDRKRYRDDPARNDRCREAGREYLNKEKKAEYIAEQRQKHPEKFRARRAVAYHLKAGNITREPCYFCGSETNLQAHHEDYDLPLDVVWLCASCHGKLHAIKGDFRRGEVSDVAS